MWLKALKPLSHLDGILERQACKLLSSKQPAALLSLTNTPTQTHGIALSGGLGAFMLPRSVLHHPGSVRLMITSEPSVTVARSVVNLSRAAFAAE